MSDETPPKPEAGFSETRPESELTPEKAYDLHVNQGQILRDIADLYGVSVSTVYRRKEAYASGYQKGRESVSPSDFDLDDIRAVLKDDETESPYMHNCPGCNRKVLPENAPECPQCGAGPISWDE